MSQVCGLDYPAAGKQKFLLNSFCFCQLSAFCGENVAIMLSVTCFVFSMMSYPVILKCFVYFCKLTYFPDSANNRAWQECVVPIRLYVLSVCKNQLL